jgi:hypothetical protein
MKFASFGVKVAACVLLAAFARPSHAEETYLSGTVIDVTSGASGLLVRLSTGVPGNCTGVSYGWMLISETNKTMIAVALLTWQNHGGATVFTYALSGGNCTINQFDPWD